MLMKMKHILATLALLLACAGIQAQVTTSSMGGMVTDAQGEAVIGATVQAIHEPSGSQYGAITNVDGRYTIQGMRTGGPYRVTITYVGYQTVTVEGVSLQLGEQYNLNVQMEESSELLDEVVVTAAKTKFTAERTGATTNISSVQMQNLPTINRSIEDIARISPYANGMGFAGGDGRSTNFTIDGANFNNNFGLSEDLPGGGNPISMDALEEVQVVIAPYDVRQTNFIGGGINAVTKSGTNTFKGSAYTYHYNDNMRGNRVDGESMNVPAENDKHVYGATFGGPIIKNKLFFFANVEYQKIPSTAVNWRASADGVADPDNYISRTKLEDMQRVQQFMREKYGYDTGSYTSFPADESNLKLLGRIDWNISNAHKLAVRYNYTKNTAWNQTNGNSGDTGYRLNGMNRFSEYSMAFANSLYSMENKVQSVSADLNSRFGDRMSNQLLFTYTNIQDVRGTNSSMFPFIDIMAGYDDVTGVQTLEPYMSLGYELFTYNNAVNNKILTLTDNYTLYLGAHKLTAGFSYEHQLANNAYMRNGTGYYRYRSLDDFLSGAAPEAFALTYGYNGERTPAAQVRFNQIGFYVQDEWNIVPRFKLTAGIRFDELLFNGDDVMRNNAIYALDFGGKHIDTGAWPDARMQFSPRVGFVWDVLGDNRLKVRGGTGLFAGRLPLVYFTNMPSNSGMVQNSVSIVTRYNNDGTVASRDPRLDLLKGGMLTNVDDMIEKLGLPTTISPEEGQVPSGIAGVDPDFKMPQVWKSSIAVDYQLPTSFPLSVTGEFMYTKNVNAVNMVNWNIKPVDDTWQRFTGADDRLIYPTHQEMNADGKMVTVNDFVYYDNITSACVLTNTHKGYGYTLNFTVNAEPVKNLALMASYTRTESKELTGLPGNNANSTWQGLYTVDGPNHATVQRSQYVIPDRVIASVNYTLESKRPGFDTHFNLFYSGYSAGGYSFLYSNDMNGDGIQNDLIYIPKDDSEIAFTNDADRQAFWQFVNQDSYLKNHKGEYAEAYAARAPWVHRFDLSIVQDFSLKVGRTTNKLQLSFDIMNIGNLFNSTWGVRKNMNSCNSGRILKYEGRDAQNRPTFSMWRDSNGNAPTQTYTYNRYYDECWRLQVGVRYIFN